MTSVRRYVWLEFADRDVNPDRVTVPRPTVEPGSEAQIDYGYLGQWHDPIADRLRKVWVFVMVLACSRHMFVRPVLRMDQTAWVAAQSRRSSSSAVSRPGSCRTTWPPG